jgi:hypothetical protein
MAFECASQDNKKQGFVILMVNKSKAVPAPGKKTAGRRPGNPEDVRTERLVVRMHPDMFESLTDRAKVYGVSRSQYVERILIGYLNAQEGQRTLDLTGRFVRDEATRKAMMTSPADTWAAFGKRNLALLGMQAERAAALAGKQVEDDDD